MTIMNVRALQGDVQIGGGAGYVAEQLREAALDARAAMAVLTAPVAPGVPHPRSAALAAARESVIHLNEALSIEAPEDALIDTRHALEQLTITIAALERMGDNTPIVPGTLPIQNFNRAVELLVQAERKLLAGTPPTWGLEQG